MGECEGNRNQLTTQPFILPPLHGALFLQLSLKRILPNPSLGLLILNSGHTTLNLQSSLHILFPKTHQTASNIPCPHGNPAFFPSSILQSPMSSSEVLSGLKEPHPLVLQGQAPLPSPPGKFWQITQVTSDLSHPRSGSCFSHRHIVSSKTWRLF